MMWIKRRRSGCLLALALFAAGYAHADDASCKIMSSTKTIDYGQFRKDDMRAGQTDYQNVNYQWLATEKREFTVSVSCESTQKIRIFVEGGAKQNKLFRFSTAGAMILKAKDARMDNQSVQLIAVAHGVPISTQSAAQEVTVPPGYDLVAMNGQELAGKQFVITFNLTTYLPPKVFIANDNTDMEEILTLDYEATSP